MNLDAREQPLQPGDLLQDRFLIVREVAQGGMGVVYEAVDQKLERRIAIKFAKSGFGKQLSPEVRSAREVSHPNVCKIFEIHTAAAEIGGFDFITMEFLDGETLAARLKAGPVPEREARAIARQLASGLAAAHRTGVVHGDLKSNNVILTKDAGGALRAVITDFGLARAPDRMRSARFESTGGTPAYMAPELWKGEKATAVSDVYAFGVMLYELVSGGRHPFSRASRPLGEHDSTETLPAEPRSREEWLKRIERQPQPVHPKWDRILKRALDPDPARRFQDASQILQALSPPKWKRQALVAAAVFALAIASALIASERAAAPKETIHLAVMPMVAASGEAAEPARIVSQDLSGRIAALHGDSRKKFTRIPDTALPARNAAIPGATHLLRGSIAGSGKTWLLEAMLVDTRSGVTVKSWNARYAGDEIRYAGTALAGFVTDALDLPPLEAHPSVNAAALVDYSTGLALIRTNLRADDAVSALERAVAADRDSPLAYATLAEAQWLEYFLTNDDAWKQRMQESVRQAEIRNPDLAAVHRVAGLLAARAGNYEIAAAHYRRAIELDPSHGDGYRRLGAVYEDNNQLNEAKLQFQKALAADPNYFRLQQDVGSFYLDQTMYREALPYFQRAVELAPDEPNPRFALGVDFEDLGRFEDAERELRQALRLKETTNALHTLGIVLMYEGRTTDAIPYLERTVHLESERYLAWMDLGICYRREHRPADAAAANRRGLRAAEAEMARDPRSGYVRSFLAYLCAATGNRPRAESEIAQALQLSPTNADARWTAVLTYELLGERDAALAVLRASTSETIANINRWPDAEGLRADARFEQMLGERQVK